MAMRSRLHFTYKNAISTAWTALLLITALSPAHVLASSTIRNPIRALYTVQNSTIHTSSHRVTALSDFDLSFIIHDDVHVKLSLTPNHDILPAEGVVVSYLGADGEVTRQESVDRLQHKVYRGKAWVRRYGLYADDQWLQAGWARVTVRRDGVAPLFEGAFSVDHDNHHIQMSSNFERTRHPLDPELQDAHDEYMVLYRDSDIRKHHELSHAPTELRRSLDGGLTCESDNISFNIDPNHPVYTNMLKPQDSYWGGMSMPSIFGKRQIDSSTGGNSAGVNLSTTIGSTAGCPTTRKVALVGVATDCTYTADFNSTESARQNIISQMNSASSVWESAFNISLGLRNLTISDASCPATPSTSTPWNQGCSDSVTISDRLNMFGGWRGEQVDTNSHWTLLSTCNTNSEVGLAWLGQACVAGSYTTNTTTGNETIAGANFVVRTAGASEWQIIAHETGHTFGAVHDCTSTTCANSETVSSSQCCPLSSTTCDAESKYIMNPSTASGITTFSPCTIGNICSAIGRNSVNTTCLSDNRDVTTITGQECGNGIVESGEECDCGGEEGCGDDPCCDPTTCTFKDGAVCDDSNDDCCTNCQMSANNTICRASTGVCDPAETCTGTSATCPVDITSPNGDSCGTGLTCASGECTSRNLQCKSVMGSYTTDNDTYACDSSSCTITCASPEFGTGVCYALQQNFLDGTPCSGTGYCSNGQCKGVTTASEIRSWIQDNKALVIGLAAGIGGLLLVALLSCLVTACRRVRRRGAVKTTPSPSPPPGDWNGWNGPPVPVHSRPREGEFAMSGADGGRPMWDQGQVRGVPSVPPPAYGTDGHPMMTQRYA